MMLTDTVFIRLKQAEHVLIFTGAGVSAESGIKTFRDHSTGLWEGVDPMQVATPEAFAENPQRVWDFYVARAETVRKAAPNAAHLAIAQLSAAVKRLTLVTQNVDGLHQKAGSKAVLELHGNIFKLKPFDNEEAAFADGGSPVICHVCDGYADPDDICDYASREDFDAIQLVARPVPKCPGCASLLRPSVTWFGERLDPQILSDAIAAVEQCDCLLCIGSSLAVEPASTLPRRALVYCVN